ncbi:hypothetical protein L3X39_05610 [Sabulilitoribacter multivorans]|uniref:Outer membrane protein beta-barrel domain-containing protein n=1 Tax=Flaviramulus multivorans TaxID=1304750 RepID=A0ABS9IIA3_9FLAO|nr:hypothetical protein [Flaviramulus multivorans]MCF7560108.1 hypothetical protein [Flaviramulus multivorans]
MKKLFLLSFALLGFAFASSGQTISENALGLRLGDSDGLGAEISYQRALGDNNRLELDFGWRDGNNYNAFKLTGLYQWVWVLDGSFNWYAGVGGGIASFDGKNVLDGESETALFAAGDIGIEYNFDIPLQLSLDFRPELGFGDFRDDLDFDIALGIRYQF